ncbi:hypothetical protein O6H91_05G060200 [Diphasiastrum complanatum]|uniref:Uncharacterized protein n=1 Tax=Diphasiastrum complanatum TaxID=34168 RepID=A0ACC2DNR3_DIPCM|nr:hypothetical protein O6H91_Y200000 [Diphasiastrum complanatum]KAJ7555900.1 hypothetical protein O6H91_05G060200 [Diphasiastrum complanatum]
MAHFDGSGVFGDTTLTKLFVGGLAWETQRDTMSRYFEQFGEILEAVVISDKNTGRSKGYGFVTFRDPDAARKACENPTPVIDGRRTNCNLASLGARLRPSPSPLGGIQFRALQSISAASAAGGFVATSTFAQPGAAQYAFQHGLYAYPSHYGYPAYSPDYSYHQSLYNPYGGAQYAAIYPGQGAVANPAVYTYSAYGQPLHYPGSTYAPTAQAYAVQGPHLMQYAPIGHTSLTAMPQHAGTAPIHAAAPSSGYSVQSNPSLIQPPQATLQQFAIAHLGPQQGGNSEQPSG